MSRRTFYSLALVSYPETDKPWFVTKTTTDYAAVKIFTVLASAGYSTPEEANARMKELDVNLVWEEFVELFRHI